MGGQTGVSFAAFLQLAQYPGCLGLHGGIYLKQRDPFRSPHRQTVRPHAKANAAALTALELIGYHGIPKRSSRLARGWRKLVDRLLTGWLIIAPETPAWPAAATPGTSMALPGGFGLGAAITTF